MFVSILNSAQCALAVLMGCSIASDIKSRRIPNAIVLLGIGIAVSVQGIAVVSGMTSWAGDAWWSPLAGLVTGLALLMPMYLLRATGAGDVKLMAMVGAFIGAPAVVSATLYTLLAGGLLSLLFMFGRGVAVQTLSNVRFLLTDLVHRASTGQGARLAPLQVTAARLPYAIAIALGTAAALRWPLSLA